MDSVQANESGECPTGYTACSSSSETKWYDVYCLVDDFYPAKCPILTVTLIDATENIASLGASFDWSN